MSELDGRYVVQKHTQADGVHWDLMLEDGEILRTWRLDIGPEDVLDRPAVADKIFDHSLRFLTYEGPVQNGTGTVEIADRGTFRFTLTDQEQSVMKFSGQILRGEFVIKTDVNGVCRLMAL